jgi:branched-chain amino acid transport system substrate-binding protein
MGQRMIIVVRMAVGLLFLLSASGAVLAADVAKIGILGPTTGGVAIVGTDSLRGVQVAAKEVNEKGGITVGNKAYKVEFIDMDDGAVVANSVANARRLVALHKVPVIIGPPISSCALAVLEFNDKRGTEFLMMTMAMHPELVKRGNKLIVRTNTPTKQLGERLAMTVMKMKKIKSVAIINHTDDWGMSWKEGLEEGAKRMEGKVTSVEGIDERKQTDFYPQLTKIVATNPEGIFMIAHDSVTAIMVKQVREVGYKGRLIFSEGFGEPGRKLVMDKLEGCMWPGYPMDFNTPGARRYKELFAKQFPNEPPHVYGALTYDQLRIILLAMEKSQSVTDPYKIRAAVPGVLPIPNSVNMHKTCQENGQVDFDYIIAELKGGKTVEAQAE